MVCWYVLFTRAGDGDGVQGPDTAQCAGAYLFCAVSSDCTHKERLRSVLELGGLAVICSVHVLERAVSPDHTSALECVRAMAVCCEHTAYVRSQTDINDAPPDPHRSLPEPAAAARPKPWESRSPVPTGSSGGDITAAANDGTPSSRAAAGGSARAFYGPGMMAAGYGAARDVASSTAAADVAPSVPAWKPPPPPQPTLLPRNRSSGSVASGVGAAAQNGLPLNMSSAPPADSSTATSPQHAADVGSGHPGALGEAPGFQEVEAAGA
jgi:hypothetical protein